MKKIICLFLIALMLTPSIVSCGGSKPPVDGTTTPAVTTAGITNDPGSEGTGDPTGTTEPAELPDIPEGINYDNHTFTVLISGNSVNEEFHSVEGASDIESEAVYRKNMMVEEQLGIIITDVNVVSFGSTTGGGPGYTRFKQSYVSASCDYDIGMIGTYDAAFLAKDGYLTDIHEVPYIDTSRSWWDQKANKDLSINDKLFFTTGDISLRDNKVTHCILFNKTILENTPSLINPYELVREDKWTYDVFSAEVKKVGEDVNGDDIMDTNDKYGLMTWNDAALAVLNSSLSRVCDENDDGKLELTLNNEKSIAVLEKYAEIHNSEHCFNYQVFNTSSASWDPNRNKLFDEDLAYFYMNMVGTAVGHRDKETDFGFIPYPKLSEEQEDYGHLISSFHSSFLCIPYYSEDIERTGVIVETLAYTSQKILTPAYYDKVLNGTLIRDEESSEMLDIIFASRLYDLGIFYRISANFDLASMISQDKVNTFASTIERLKRVVTAELNQINKQFSTVIN